MASASVKDYKTEFKYVCERHINGNIYFCTKYAGFTKKSYPTAREAAIAIDKILIGLGKEPCNVLVRK